MSGGGVAIQYAAGIRSIDYHLVDFSGAQQPVLTVGLDTGQHVGVTMLPQDLRRQAARLMDLAAWMDAVLIEAGLAVADDGGGR